MKLRRPRIRNEKPARIQEALVPGLLSEKLVQYRIVDKNPANFLEDAKLFVSQCNHRINFGRAASWQ
jgi:hypothetical protein